MAKQVKVVRLLLPTERDVQRVLNSRVRVIRLPRHFPNVVLSIALVVALWAPGPPPPPWT